MSGYKMKGFIFVSGLLFLIVCGGPMNEKDVTAAHPFSLNSFNNIPPEIDGCSCYFSDTEEKFKQREYIFAAEFDSAGFISIDNKLVKLNLVSTTRKQGEFGNYDHTDVYGTDQYKVTIDIKYKKTTGEETWWNKGTITIENKDGQKIINKCVGECGC